MQPRLLKQTFWISSDGLPGALVDTGSAQRGVYSGLGHVAGPGAMRRISGCEMTWINFGAVVCT